MLINLNNNISVMNFYYQNMKNMPHFWNTGRSVQRMTHLRQQVLNEWCGQLKWVLIPSRIIQLKLNPSYAIYWQEKKYMPIWLCLFDSSKTMKSKILSRENFNSQLSQPSKLSFPFWQNSCPALTIFAFKWLNGFNFIFAYQHF